MEYFSRTAESMIIELRICWRLHWKSRYIFWQELRALPLVGAPAIDTDAGEKVLIMMVGSIK